MLLRTKQNLHEPTSTDEMIHASFEANSLYVCLGTECGWHRIVNSKGEPILIPNERVDIVDNWIPHSWKSETDDEGNLSCTPPEFGRGFFERWHDHNIEARQAFAKVYLPLYFHYQAQLSGQLMQLKFS
jgi:hypothetical protein